MIEVRFRRVSSELTGSLSVQYAGPMSNNAERRIDETHGGPLSDVRVLELGTLIAGPFAGRLFADLAPKSSRSSIRIVATRSATGG